MEMMETDPRIEPLERARSLVEYVDGLVAMVEAGPADEVAISDVTILGAAQVASAYAQVAVAAELRALREELPGAARGALLEALGDDSHLDKLVVVLRDLPDAVERAIGAGLFHRR